MSDQWSSDPGAYPPAPAAVPSGWHTRPGQLAPEGPPPFGSGPALPPLPPQAPRQGSPTRTLVIVVSVLAVLLLLVSAALVVVVRTDDSQVATGTSPTTAPPTTDGPTSPSSPTPTSPSSPTTVNPTPTGPPPTKEELDAEIAELSQFVERERGLTFKEPVAVTMADEATFNERLFADFDEDEASRQETGRVLKALGLINSDVDIDELLRQLLGAGVLGFYDPKTAELVIRGEAITPYTRETIVHELTHALDDQHFELDRPEYDTIDDETGFGFAAVVEGDARRVEGAYVISLSPADQARRDEEEARFAAATAPLLADVPMILLKTLQAPYEYGQTFVQSLLDYGDQGLLDGAIADPPTTSSQILHPDLFLSGTGRVEVTPPAADGTVIDQGVFGEVMTQFTLEDSEDPNTAATAAAGWAGDWYVTWEDDEGSTCIRIAYEMDTAPDLDQLEEAYTSWAGPKGATVERPDPDHLEVTSCSGAAGGSSPL